MEKVNFYFGLFMAAIYFAVGTALVFFLEIDAIAKPNRIGAGIVLMLFGCFRIYRILIKRKHIFHPEILDAPDDQD